MGTIEATANNLVKGSRSAATLDVAGRSTGVRSREPLSGAYFWLVAFLVVYCTRPGDWIPGLQTFPLAKITGALAFVAFFLGVATARRKVLRIPREMKYLVLLFVQLCLSVPFSPVWRGGAFNTVFNVFSKVVVISIVISFVVTTMKRLRRLIFVQVASIVVISGVTILANYRIASQQQRLTGVLGGIYGNPNDLAFAITLAMPFCFMAMVGTYNVFKKLALAAVMGTMTYAVLNTYSRSGFIVLVVSLGMCLWDSAVKRRRYASLVLVAVMAIGMVVAGMPGHYGGRLETILHPQQDMTGSALARKDLLLRSLAVTVHHPLLGIGAGNFPIASGSWHVAHNSFTELSAEAGVPALILFLLILGRSFVVLGDIRRTAQGESRVLLLAVALRASLCGFVVGACFSSVEYHFFPYFLVGYSSALHEISRRMESQASKELTARSREDKSDREVVVAGNS